MAFGTFPRTHVGGLSSGLFRHSYAWRDMYSCRRWTALDLGIDFDAVLI